MVIMVQNHTKLAEICQLEVMRKKLKFIEIRRSIDEINQWESNRSFSTHLYPEHADFSQMLGSSPLKVIYVVRDLRDVLASWYFYMRDIMTKGHFDVTFDEYFEMFTKKQLPYGDWFDNVTKWMEVGQQFPDQFMFVKYEDIHADHSGFVHRLAEFCDVKLGNDVVKEIVKRSSFNELKVILNNRNTVTQDPEEYARKGIVGDWKSTFTHNALEYFDSNVKDKEPYKSLYGTI